LKVPLPIEVRVGGKDGSDVNEIHSQKAFLPIEARVGGKGGSDVNEVQP
jgi:hypothetical protein